VTSDVVPAVAMMATGMMLAAGMMATTTVMSTVMMAAAMGGMRGDRHQQGRGNGGRKRESA